jgi:peptidoglycan/LPS O-acetylase OafA/YrhL
VLLSLNATDSAHMTEIETKCLVPCTAWDEKAAVAAGLPRPPTAEMRPKSKSLSHIAHLNGLRAMAFIGVFLFHFRYGCQGGFLGVDVFFVLSGYLMTRSIANQITRGTYTYWSFLVRRFWRLYPALLVTIIVSMRLTYGFFSNEHALQAAKSALASVFGISNFLFMSEEGYFGTESAFKPLLHTWSLSAEWQFYLLWPVLMAMGSRWAPKVRALWPLVIMCVVSFVHNVLLAKKLPMAAFFMLPPRAFEFGIGAIASLPYIPRVESRFIGNSMSFIGSSLVLFSFQFINSTHGAPAVIAMPSLVGAVMVILSPSDAFANGMFTSTIFDYIGKISYSAYLVHWPAFVFYQNIYEHAPAPWYIAAAVISGVIFLSAIMFHMIEDEYRVPESRRHSVVGLGLLCIAILMSLQGIRSQGWNTRESPRSIPVHDNGYYLREYTKLYSPKREQLPGSKATVEFGTIPVSTQSSVAAGDDFEAVVVGDSFCAPLAGVFNEIAKQDNKTYVMMSHHSCASFFDKESLDVTLVHGPNFARVKKCKAELRPEMLGLIRATKSKIVVLSSNWLATRQMIRANRESAPTSKNEFSSSGLRKSQLEETIDILNNLGRKVIMVGMVPGAHFNVRACLAASGPLAEFKKCPEVTRFKAPFVGTAEAQDKMKRRAVIRNTISAIFQQTNMQKARQERNLVLIDPYEALCDDRTGECLTSRNGEPYYSDDMHLTISGAMLLKERIQQGINYLS